MELNEIHPEHEQATTTLKVVLLVFAIVLVGALAYLVWAQNTTPDMTDNSAATVKTNTSPTAGWKTYTDNTNGFTVKYPPGLNPVIDTASSSVAFGKQGTFVITTKTTTLTLSQFVADEKNSSSILGEQPTKLSGVTAEEAVGLGLVNGYTIITVHGGKSYELFFAEINEDTLERSKADMSSTQKLILSSFKFTK